MENKSQNELNEFAKLKKVRNYQRHHHITLRDVQKLVRLGYIEIIEIDGVQFIREI